MNLPKGSSRGRRTKNTVTTKSGNTLKVNRSLNDRRKASKAARSAAKATYLSTLPKNRFKRILYRLHPKRVAQYWFSREGGIMALKVIGVAFIAGFIVTIGLFAYFRKDLPKIKDLAGSSFGGNVTYYDRTGQTVLWQDYDAVKRTPVPSADISNYLKDATIAIEDKDFYHEGAFNVRGIVRATVNDASGGATQGGSTITQQLVKLNEGWTNDRTVTRKVKELILAEELEREYSKDDILSGYLNLAPYGGVDYGAEIASQDYFHTSAKNLTLEQAAMLAAIPQAPGGYSPYSSPKYNPEATQDYFDSDALLTRQHYILDKMVAQGYVSQAQANAAKKVDILAEVQPQTSRYSDIKAPYFVLAAKEQLQQTYGTTVVARGGWKVTTTLDMNLQNKAEQLAASNLAKVKRAGGDEEAMVGEDVQTGQIVTMVGGADFSSLNENNYAAGIKIPPGSSFKPYDYSTLINNNNNVGASSVLYDSQGALPGYPCTDKTAPEVDNPSDPGGSGKCLFDFDRRFPGATTIRYAFGGSRNVPAVKAMTSAVPNDNSKNKVNSINSVIKTADAMIDNTYDQAHNISAYSCYADEALTVSNQCYSASAIGDGAYLTLDDHVNGLSTLARLGNAIPRTFIMKITDASQKSIYQWTQPKPNQVIKQDTAYIMDDIASDPKASYLSGSCTDTNCVASAGFNGVKFHRFNGWHFAIKTGTTNNNYDGLMTSWSTKYAMVSWVGSQNRNVALSSEMEYLTEPLTGAWMEYAHQNIKPVNWTAPTDIKTLPSYVQRTASYSTQQLPGPSTDLYPSWYVGGTTAKGTTSVTTDKVSGKVATSCTPADAKDTATNSNAQYWNIDIFMGGKTSISTGTATGSTTTSSSPTDDVHNCNDSPPTITLTAPASCSTSCTITATVTQGTHSLTDPNYPQYPGTVTFNLGSNQIYTTSVSNSPSTVSFTYTPTSSGTDTLTATVTDSVLYQASDTASLAYSTPNATPVSTNTLSGFTAVVNGNLVQLSWSGGTAPFNITRSDNGLPLCSNIQSNTCQYTKTLAPSSTSITIKDNSNPVESAVTQVP